jgi:diguanylate cyclase (GGDEF)-like protein
VPGACTERGGPPPNLNNGCLKPFTEGVDDIVMKRTPAQWTTRRFDPMSGSWPMIVVDVVCAIAIVVPCIALSQLLFDGVWEWVGYVAFGTMGVFLFIAWPLRHFLMQQRREAETREALLASERDLRDFESRLGRALDMASDEPAAVNVATRAMQALSSDLGVEVLLADSSRAHLTRTARYAGTDLVAGCEVATPGACPAVRSGHALRFDDSEEFDACPHLRDRPGDPLTAVCIPVSVMGSSVGVVHAVRARGTAIGDRESAGLSAVAHQLGARIGLVTAMSQSQLQANTDPLTGLLNRRSLENEVRILVQEFQSFALIIADLDHFKALNDTHGHDAGDRALRMFARLLRRTLRDDDLLCRYGGEEFIMVLPGLPGEKASIIFDRVRLELDAAGASGQLPPFTVSAGVADSEEATTLPEIITLADMRLREAKSNGRNRTVGAPA